ncbi:diaminopropionate ammonia-lyase [Kocuria rhizophila]|uniref:diaminopropionate ammonia-lyase n=1 Tax=Kocuria rhizophila TaxID=72000 RepID=UPI001ABDD68B|nr:diaminopropionate ammonia-lyase [Kocuria rhizophila]MBO4145058.1 diaminopropionate ammonia-lyase [Kocuria rhizophila]MDN3225243.1 diaminopropionate ammonia-lyase [Kocuria rhizophila]QTK31752.1 diaminopropionate ammonia-lyase [Kocuria rhizophila]
MTTPHTASLYLNIHAAQWRTTPGRASAHELHRSMTGYAPTALRELPALAAELGVGRVFVKDESDRLGLPAFKILGASWAVCRAVAQRIGLPAENITVESLREGLRAAGSPQLTIVTATDGNHGRAVARMAALLGLRARVYIPGGVGDTAVRAIEAEGAPVIFGGPSYDDAVATAARSAAGPDELLVQDTSWPGYEEVPRWIVEGYMTLFAEADEQLAAAGAHGADLVACPVGVGALAHAMVDHYRGVARSTAALLTVEPRTADCVAQSLRAGEPVTVDTSAPTMMAGLNCGTPSGIGWPTIRDGVSAAVSVTEDECRRAVGDLQGLGQDSGPCGAASLAGVRELLGASGAREELGLGEDSVALLISTEGLGANPLPAA